MQKIDRTKLYGFKEVLVYDEHETECELATLAEDGKTLVGKGGTGIGQLTADGKWTDKSKLKPIDLEGNEIQPVPSSFAAPIELTEVVTVDNFLEHNIRLIYRLNIESGSESEEALHQSLKNGEIFRFPYSYRGGLEADTGFLMMNENDEIFFLVGDSTEVDFVGLQQVSTATSQDSDDTDLMDFSMM